MKRKEIFLQTVKKLKDNLFYWYLSNLLPISFKIWKHLKSRLFEDQISKGSVFKGSYWSLESFHIFIFEMAAMPFPCNGHMLCC